MLEAEGLFREERKRPLPEYPGAVGVVTSRSGSATFVKPFGAAIRGSRSPSAGRRCGGMQPSDRSSAGSHDSSAIRTST